MLKRLADRYPDSVAPLTFQYRMHRDICRLSSEAVYGGKLKCANDEVATQLLRLPGFPSSLPRAKLQFRHWLVSVINPNTSVLFADTDNIKRGSPNPSTSIDSASSNAAEGTDELEGTIGRTRGGNVVNHTEATLVRYVIKGLVSAGLDPSSIGVICPFKAQVSCLHTLYCYELINETHILFLPQLRILEENNTIADWQKQGLELSTIDRYQGRDKDAVILCFVRSNSRGKAGRLLQDMRRLNVALTRAKRKLVMIGSYSTLSVGSAALKPILLGIDARNQRFRLPCNAVECYDIP